MIMISPKQSLTVSFNHDGTSYPFSVRQFSVKMKIPRHHAPDNLYDTLTDNRIATHHLMGSHAAQLTAF